MLAAVTALMCAPTRAHLASPFAPPQPPLASREGTAYTVKIGIDGVGCGYPFLPYGLVNVINSLDIAGNVVGGIEKGVSCSGDSPTKAVLSVEFTDMQSADLVYQALVFVNGLKYFMEAIDVYKESTGKLSKTAHAICGRNFTVGTTQQVARLASENAYVEPPYEEKFPSFPKYPNYPKFPSKPPTKYRPRGLVFPMKKTPSSGQPGASVSAKIVFADADIAYVQGSGSFQEDICSALRSPVNVDYCSVISISPGSVVCDLLFSTYEGDGKWNGDKIKLAEAVRKVTANPGKYFPRTFYVRYGTSAIGMELKDAGLPLAPEQVSPYHSADDDSLPNHSADDDSDDSNPLKVALIVVAVLAGIALCALLFVLCRRHRSAKRVASYLPEPQSKRSNDTPESESSGSDHDTETIRVTPALINADPPDGLMSDQPSMTPNSSSPIDSQPGIGSPTEIGQAGGRCNVADSMQSYVAKLSNDESTSEIQSQAAFTTWSSTSGSTLDKGGPGPRGTSDMGGLGSRGTSNKGWPGSRGTLDKEGPAPHGTSEKEVPAPHGTSDKGGPGSHGTSDKGGPGSLSSKQSSFKSVASDRQSISSTPKITGRLQMTNSEAWGSDPQVALPASHSLQSEPVGTAGRVETAGLASRAPALDSPGPSRPPSAASRPVMLRGESLPFRTAAEIVGGGRTSPEEEVPDWRSKYSSHVSDRRRTVEEAFVMTSPPQKG
eukprot:gene2593-30986_t